MKKIIKLIIFGFLGLCAIVLLIVFIALPFHPDFADGKVLLNVKNNSHIKIDVKIEVVNLDTNRSDVRQISKMTEVGPGKRASAVISLDGWAPESCRKIHLYFGSEKKEFDCAQNENIDGVRVSRTNIEFSEQ